MAGCGIDGSGEVQRLLAGGFDKAAVARARAAFGRNGTSEIKVLIGPDGDLAAVAFDNRIGVDHGALRHADIGRIRFKARAMKIAADQGATAALCAGDIDVGAG